jgi:diadenosine tetraphosphatase ApaH/serine/threonine PP2A family protein phosphatase
VKIAILSDIHANREALTACLADARRRDAERLVFLGDIVGYGADPGWCVDTVAAKVALGAACVRGNHDEAIGTPDAAMNLDALRAIDWTRRQLDDPQKRFLAGLPYRMDQADGDALFVHANGWAPQNWGYVNNEIDAERSLRATTQRLTFCGHTHVPALYAMAPLRPPMAFEPQAGKDIPLVASRRWLAVVGSVGQPRDGHPAASYGWFETSPAAFTLLRVPYDVETAARKVREAGLPESLAARLLRGR